jgi:hypothetical protein
VSLVGGRAGPVPCLHSERIKERESFPSMRTTASSFSHTLVMEGMGRQGKTGGNGSKRTHRPSGTDEERKENKSQINYHQERAAAAAAWH